jgi:hypothetical protein
VRLAIVAPFVHNLSLGDAVGVMSGWKDIADLAVAMVVKQPPFTEIAIGLGVAFSILMFLEGLRANFLPQRRQNPPQRLLERSSRQRAAVKPMQAKSVSFRSIPSGNARTVRNLKISERVVSRRQTMRPGIHRKPPVANLFQPDNPTRDVVMERMENVAADFQSTEALPQTAAFEG